MIRKIFSCLIVNCNLTNIIFQIYLLMISEITLQNCIFTFSKTFPILLFFLRYLHFITLFSYVSEISKIKLFILLNIFTYGRFYFCTDRTFVR